jgi:hypothetical protein
MIASFGIFDGCEAAREFSRYCITYLRKTDMKKSRFFGKILLISAAITLILPHSSFSAQTCTPLLAVGGEAGQTVVQKTVSVPRIPIRIGNLKRDNWNTDFAVRSNVKYKRFVATLNPQTDGTYSIRMYLKYSNGTADEVYNNKPNLSSGKPLVMSGTPRTQEQPYQINIFVGDAESIAKSYKISVKACR